MQNFLEDKILQLDYKTFVGLIYSNPNNTPSIFDMPKPQKRKILENLFSLDSYSELNKKATAKINELKEINIKLNSQIESDLKYINELKQNNSSLQSDIDNIDISTDKLTLLKKQSENIDNEKYSNDYISKIKEETEKFKSIVQKIESSIKNVNIKNKNNNFYDDNLGEELKKYSQYDIDENLINRFSNKLIEIKTKIKNFEKYSRYDINEIDNDIIDQSEELKHISFDSNELKEIEKQIIETKLIFTQKIEELDKIKESFKYKDNINCPVCGSTFSDEKYIENHLKNEENRLTEEKNDLFLKLKESKNKRDLLIESRNKREEITKNLDDLHKIKNNVITYQRYFNTLNKLSNYYDNEKNKKIETEKYNDVNSKIKEQNNYLRYIKAIEKLEKSRIYFVSKLNECKSELLNIVEWKKSLDIFDKIKEEENSIKNKKSEISRIKKYIQDNNDKIIKFNKEIESSQKSLDINISDINYFLLIKKLCGDDQIKQYAISNIVPIINQKVNQYLSDCGMNYYVVLDGWLDAEIKGPGISSCSVGNLSGAEKKSLDLAIQMALYDILKLKAKNIPDILILDEVLDSSVDSEGVQKLMNIISLKQKNDNLKVFLISHRKEISDIGIEKIIYIIKEAGYSKINEK